MRKTPKPFEELCPRIQDLVAEANSSSSLAFCWVTDLMPSTLREIQKPGLPHCSRRFFFYTTGRNRVQGDVYEVEAALWNPAPSTTHDSSLRCESCSGLTVFIHCADVRIFDGCHKDSHGLPGPEQCVSACSAQIRVPTKRRARGPAPHKLPHRSYKVTADSAMGRCRRIGPSHCHAAEQTGPARRSRGVSPPSRAEQAHSNCY